MSDLISQIRQLQGQLFRGNKPDYTNIRGRWLDAAVTEMTSGTLRQGSDLFKIMISHGWDENRLSNCGLSSSQGIPVIIAAKNILLENQMANRTKQTFHDRIKTESVFDESTGIFFVPAILDHSGQLMPSNNLFPWFADLLSKESAEAYRAYVAQRIGLLGKIPDWKTWISLAFDLFQKVSGVPFNSPSVFGCKLADIVYIIPDDNTYRLSPLNSLYNNMLRNDRVSKLAKNILSDTEISDKKRFSPKGVDNAFGHSGHVDNMQALSASHRAVVEQIIKLEQGGVLAVNAPLGTAPEVCVLNTIASRVVNAAVLEEKPPLDVILIEDKREIEFWSKQLNLQCDKTHTEQQEALAALGYSWISGAGLPAAVLTGDSEHCDLSQSNMFTVGVGSDRGLIDLDNPQKIKEITEKVIENCSKYFKEELPSLEKCRSKIHETLVSVDYARQSLLLTGVRIQRFIQADTSGQDLLFFPEDELDQIIAKRSQLLERLGEWAKHFKAVPISLRIGANSDLGKIKLKAYYEAFRNEDEISRIPDIETYDDVEKGLSAYDQELAGQEAVLDEIVRQQDKTERMIRKLGKIGLDIELLKKYISQPDKINHELDRSLRLLAFWLAVHYFECRWLAGESIVLKHQRGRNDDHSASRYIDRLSLLTPCLLADAGTLAEMKGMREGRLSDLFILNAEEKYLSDVLPVLEYSQRLSVLGDPAASANTNFIPLDQHWDKPKHKKVGGVDVTMLSNEESEFDSIPGFVTSNSVGIGGGMIFNKDSDDKKQENSQQQNFSSNLLVQAADRSEWFMSNRDGMWLIDNIRSYEEIVSFASMMWFNDKLKANRGPAPFAGKKVGWLPMSLWQTDNNRATRVGIDYIQEKEVDEIIRWIKGNYEAVKAFYPDVPRDSYAVIVAPFGAQKELIHKAMMKEFKHLAQADIRVASLDEMIPGETYPLVLFSGVFSASDSCQLYVEDKTLLYRAVSIAADAFIYFGDINALPEKDGGTASRLRRKLKALNRKK